MKKKPKEKVTGLEKKNYYEILSPSAAAAFDYNAVCKDAEFLAIKSHFPEWNNYQKPLRVFYRLPGDENQQIKIIITTR